MYISLYIGETLTEDKFFYHHDVGSESVCRVGIARIPYNMYQKLELGKIDRPFFLKGGDEGKGMLGQYRKMNSAYFSRNFDEGRRWTMDEVNDMASGVARLNEAQKNTMLPKIADTL